MLSMPQCCCMGDWHLFQPLADVGYHRVCVSGTCEARPARALSHAERIPMMSNRWNVMKAIVWGFFLGPALSLLQVLLGNAEPPPETYGEWAGTLIGGAIGGAALFGMVAGIRNLILFKNSK